MCPYSGICNTSLQRDQQESSMTRNAFAGGGIEVEAGLVAEGLGLPVSQMKELMREGAITSRCERGADGDAGRHRLTFFHKSRRLRLVIDSEGRLVRRTAIDFGDRPLPPALRRP
jgi:hypothetical protein